MMGVNLILGGHDSICNKEYHKRQTNEKRVLRILKKRVLRILKKRLRQMTLKKNRKMTLMTSLTHPNWKCSNLKSYPPFLEQESTSHPQ